MSLPQSIFWTACEIPRNLNYFFVEEVEAGLEEVSDDTASQDHARCSSCRSPPRQTTRPTEISGPLKLQKFCHRWEILLSLNFGKSAKSSVKHWQIIVLLNFSRPQPSECVLTEVPWGREVVPRLGRRGGRVRRARGLRIANWKLTQRRENTHASFQEKMQFCSH